MTIHTIAVWERYIKCLHIECKLFEKKCTKALAIWPWFPMKYTNLSEMRLRFWQNTCEIKGFMV